MPAINPLQDLQLLVKSRYSIIVLETAETDRAQAILRELAAVLGIPFFVWTATKGLRRNGSDSAVYATTEPGAALAHVEASRIPAVYFFEGLGDYLEDRVLAAKLKDAAEPLSKSAGALVLTGTGIPLPDSVKSMAAALQLPSPTPAEYRDLLQRVLRDLSSRMPVQVTMKAEDFARLLNHLKGLTLGEAERILTRAVGESEKNFKRAMSLSERMAPTVLWIDELEKAFASSAGEEDGGLSRRIFGSFLSWLQDRKGDVFVVATANDVSRLPPEFLRKGRFDEIFFVDLPDADARSALFAIHLKKRGKDPRRFDLGRLVEATDGFGGSEVEQAIVAGLYTAFSGGGDLSTEILLDEIGRTRPLAQIQSEKIQSLRTWAQERTRSAG